MKKILLSIATLTVVLSFTACNQDRLDIPQKGVVPIEQFYQTEEDAESAAVTVYNTVMYGINLGGGGFGAGFCIAPPMFVMQNSPSDDMYYASGNKDDHTFGLEINEFRATFTSQNSPVKKSYLAYYEIIYAANLLLNNYEYGRSANIDVNISEARVWRAWAHFYLAIYWGNPPLVDHLLTGEDRPSNTPHDEVMSWVIKELDEAAAYLPSKASLNDAKYAVRLTKEAALAFEGKAQVFAGDYAGAKVTLKKVIDSGKYALIPGERIHDLFHVAGDACEEKVFEFNSVDNPDANLGRGGFYHGMRNAACHWRTDVLASKPENIIPAEGWGGVMPTGDFARALIANDGNDSYRRKAWVISYDELLYDLPYPSDAECPTLADKQKDPKRGLRGAGYAFFGCEGYLQYKLVPLKSDLFTNDQANTAQNIQVMRYAEVLLLYAEACALTGETAGDGLKALNDIQERAGSQHISATLTLDEVKNEKRFEMFLEGCRYADLVRWGDAATVLKDQGKAVPTFRDKFPSESAIHAGYVDWSNSQYNTTYGFKSGKHELMPYPFSEIAINPNIKQNPGWD